MKNLAESILFAVASLLLIATGALADTCKGCVDLDEHSFHKLVPKFRYTLVKYDIAYPYGQKHDAFVQFAESIRDVADIIVANVGVKDYGQKDNAEFAEAQGVNTAKLPVIILYKGTHKNEAITFDEEEFTVDKLQKFVVENSNIHITLPGCVEVFDKLANKFVQGSDDDKFEILQEIDDYETDNELQVKAKKVYLLFMKKLREDSNFIQKEHQRLKKIITGGKLSEAKMQDLQNKINILHAFEPKEKTKLKTEL